MQFGKVSIPIGIHTYQQSSNYISGISVGYVSFRNLLNNNMIKAFDFYQALYS